MLTGASLVKQFLISEVLVIIRFTLVCLLSQTCPSHITVRDVSKFGTFINGVKCQGSVELKHGDTITFGTQNSSYR